MKGYGARRFSPLPVLLLAALAVVAFTAYFGTEDAGSQTGGSPSRATAPADEPVARVASKVGPSAVQINVTGTRQTPFGMQESEGVGSGVIYRKDGYIVTNNHVVEGASEVNIAFADGSTERGEVVGTVLVDIGGPDDSNAVLYEVYPDVPSARSRYEQTGPSGDATPTDSFRPTGFSDPARCYSFFAPASDPEFGATFCLALVENVMVLGGLALAAGVLLLVVPSRARR